MYFTHFPFPIWYSFSYFTRSFLGLELIFDTCSCAWGLLEKPHYYMNVNISTEQWVWAKTRNLEAKERVAFTRQRKHLLQQQQQQIIKEVKIKPFPTQLHKKQVMNRLQLPMQRFSAVFTFWKCQHHHTIFTAPFPQNSLFSTATTYWLCHILCTAEAPDLIQILRNNICLPVKSYGIFM